MYLDEMAHFDRERIPERVVHAKGAGEGGRGEGRGEKDGGRGEKERKEGSCLKHVTEAVDSWSDSVNEVHIRCA